MHQLGLGFGTVLDDTLGIRGMTIAWKTPSRLYVTLHKEFRFTRDVCASPWNAQCPDYWTVEDDGLARTWDGVCWCNPPFDRTRGAWARKAWESAQCGVTSVLLIGANAVADTAWWHRYILRSSELRFMRGRPTFTGEAGITTSMRCVLVVMRPYCQGPPQVGSINKHGEPI